MIIREDAPDATAAIDAWYRDYSAQAGQPLALAGADNSECCASDSLTFHYVEAPTQRMLHALLANQSHWRSLSDDQRVSLWPEASRVGGHDRVPVAGSRDAKALWSLLLDKLRPTS